MGKIRMAWSLALSLLGATPGKAIAEATSPWQGLTTPITAYPCGAHLLTDGSVLSHGLYRVPAIGCDGTIGCSIRFFPDSTGSYVDGSYVLDASASAQLPPGYNPRFMASAVLPDGRLIFEGGEYNFGVLDRTNLGAIYDPVANSWAPVAPPDGWTTIGGAPGVVLADGTFMIGRADPNGAIDQALLNAADLTWTPTGAGKRDANIEEGWTLLPDRSVLAIETNQRTNPTSAERYLPRTGSWVSAGMAPVLLTTSAEIGPQVLRPDGSVLVFGALSSGPDHIAIYHTFTHSWTAGPDLPAIDGQNYTMVDGPAALLPSGNVLFAASPDPGHGQAPVHFFETDGISIIQVPDPPNAASLNNELTQFLVLPTGQIFVSFCFATGYGVALPQIYTPSGRPKPEWVPIIAAVPRTLVPGATHRVSGSRFNGFSQGAMYGDDFQTATNYPLVRIVNDGTGHVFYARTFGHSSMRVNAEGSRNHAIPDHTHFTVPENIELGPAQLFVVTNGIASKPSAVTVH